MDRLERLLNRNPAVSIGALLAAGFALGSGLLVGLLPRFRVPLISADVPPGPQPAQTAAPPARANAPLSAELDLLDQEL